MTAMMQDSKYENQLFLTPRVPQGLAAAVEGLTREVIRQRPENIYVFAAHHFENLMKLREQYDNVGANNNNNRNAKILRDVNEAIKERQASVDSRNNAAEPSGWSLNETAKVLERHRSIFGETGQKMSTEQVRELANEALSKNAKVGSPKRKSEETPRTNANGSSNRKREPANFNKTDSKHVPKIISQIPIAKDIKTELKKNRISSRERKKIEEKKMQVACEYSRETTVEKTIKKSVERTKRSSYESRSEQRKSWRTEESSSTSKRKTETSTSKVEHSPKAKKTTTRSVSMDSVKNYVVHNLAGMASLEELQTPSYVEKVQEVIDETSTIIQEKVEALKTGVRKAARQQSKKDRLSGSDESKDSDKSARQRSREENTSSAKSSRENSENSNVQNKERSPEPESKNSEHSDSSNESKISLPAVRPPSSKSTSRSPSARSDSDGLILPPISPESAKSPKVKEELVLPVLSPPRSSVATPDASLDATNLDEKNEKLSRANSVEEYRDSLNVTPDLLDVPPRPDSLENPEVLPLRDESSPLETLKDKLVEIEQVQKRIEGVLDETISSDDKSQEKESSANETGSVTTLNIQDKLLEIEESEKRIEHILDSQTTVVEAESHSTNSDMKSKLQELTEVEKRIENIFINKANDEASKETAANETRVGGDSTSDKKIDNPEESRGNSALEKSTERNITLDTSESKQEKSDEIPTSNRLLSPHSFILTEGSPYEIPDSVTRVIIPDRIPSPDSDTLQIELDDGQVYSRLISSKEEHASKENTETETEEEKNSLHEAFGESVKAVAAETSIAEDDFIRGIKETHDQIISRKDLDLIKEEREREVNDTEVIDSEDEKVLKVVTSSLEEILEKDEVEYVTKEEVETAVVGNAGKEETDDLSPDAVNPVEYESTDETKETSITDAFVENTEIVENSLDIEETTERSAESTNEIKETSIATDRSTLSFDPAIPIVPELNLDSLPDLTISSFNITDDEQRDEKKSKRSSSSENLISTDSPKDHFSLDNKIVEEKSLTDDSLRGNDPESTVVQSTEGQEKVTNERTSESLNQSAQDNVNLIEEIQAEKNVSEHTKELDHSVDENVASVKEENKETNYETIENSIIKEEIIKEVISSTIKEEEVKKNETIENVTFIHEEIKENEALVHEEIKKNETIENAAVEKEEIKVDESSMTNKENKTEIKKDGTIESSSIKDKEMKNNESIKTASVAEREIKKDEAVDETLSVVDTEIKSDKSVENSLVKEKEINENESSKVLTIDENEMKKNETIEDTKIYEKEEKKIESEVNKEETKNLESEEFELNCEEIVKNTSEHSFIQSTAESKETNLISNEKLILKNESLSTKVTEQSTISEETKTSKEISRSSSSGESREKEERSESALATQSVSSIRTSDDAESRSSQASAQLVDQNRLGVIDNDENIQLADSSRFPSQCTSDARLDSDEPSIKTNTSAPRSNRSDDAETTRDEMQTIVEAKSSDRVANGEAALVADRTEQSDEKKPYHIYVPEMSTSKDVSSSSESSTFMSAATKIQAGVRGFLTRRRLQSTQRRSSTLDSVPSIQESFAVESPDSGEATTATTRGVPASNSLLQPVAESGSFLSEAKVRKKLRREDAVQRTTLSVENAFADNQLQHTGEFHDCIPLPVFDSETLALKLDRRSEKKPEPVAVEQLLEKMLLERGPGPFVDVLLLPGDAESMLQSRYLNFITSVEDVANELFAEPLLLPDTPKGLIIEEITSLDESKFNEPTSTSDNRSTLSKESATEQTPDQTENESSIAPEVQPGVTAESGRELPEREEVLSITSDVSMNIEEVLDLGDEDASLPKTNRLLSRLTGADPARSSSLSQESPLSEQERTRSPVTMMQIVPRSVEEKSDKSERSAEAGSTTAKEENSAEEKEQESPTGTKTNEPASTS